MNKARSVHGLYTCQRAQPSTEGHRCKTQTPHIITVKAYIRPMQRLAARTLPKSWQAPGAGLHEGQVLGVASPGEF